MNDAESRPSILIVNDNAAKAAFYQARLQAQFPGVDVDVATDARFATQIIKGDLPEVMVLDATIPESRFNQRITTGDYTNSLSVAEAYASQCPAGKIILLSSYAPHIGGRYPKGTVLLHEKNLDEVPAIIRSHLGVTVQGVEAPVQEEATDTAVKHKSRIQAARRSSAHNGSLEGNQGCWSEQVGNMITEEEAKRKARSIRTV